MGLKLSYGALALAFGMIALIIALGGNFWIALFFGILMTIHAIAYKLLRLCR